MIIAVSNCTSAVSIRLGDAMLSMLLGHITDYDYVQMTYASTKLLSVHLLKY